MKRSYIILHHTGAEEKDTEQIRQAHLRKGWRDIGYNYVVERDKVVVGRPLDIPGAHCKADGMNFKSIGVAVIGNLNERLPTNLQTELLVNLLVELTAKHNIADENILGHGEVKGAATKCPGKFMDVSQIKLRLIDVRKGGEAVGGLFPDISKDHWVHRDLEKAVKLEIIGGFPDGEFKGKEPLLREQYVSSIIRLLTRRANIILQKVLPTVVLLKGPGGLGSGYLIDKNTIITNVHVALVGLNDDGTLIDRLEIVLDDGTTIPSSSIQIPWGDGVKDCAIVKVPDILGITPLKLAEEAIHTEDVFAVGMPLGFRNTVTEGIISHDNRVTDTYGERTRWIQTSAAINPGNSGGALVNTVGELVGMPTWKQFYAADGRPTEGLGFCLHINEIKKVLAEAEKLSQINISPTSVKNIRHLDMSVAALKLVV